jgi:hypothetical protein
MGVGQWMRVLDTVAGLAQMTTGRRADPGGDVAGPQSSGPLGAIEARLAGVVVAALKEAFDRDKARMDLERETIEAERARAERALQAELRRQSADRTLTHLKLIAVFAGCMLLVSGALSAWIAGMRDGAAAGALAVGWAAALAALGCVFAAWPQVSRWASSSSPDVQESGAAAAAPWLLLAALALTGASVLLA